MNLHLGKNSKFEKDISQKIFIEMKLIKNQTEKLKFRNTRIRKIDVKNVEIEKMIIK